MRILILGLDGAGKTTILYRLQAGEVLIIIDQFCSSWNHPFRWWQRSRLLGSMLRRWHTRTSSSKFGTLEDRPAFDLTGGAIIPTPMQSYTSSIVQTGIGQYIALKFYTLAEQSYSAQCRKDLIIDFWRTGAIDGRQETKALDVYHWSVVPMMIDGWSNQYVQLNIGPILF